MAITPTQLGKLILDLLVYAEKCGFKTIEFSRDDAVYQKIWFHDRDIGGNPPSTWGDLNEDLESLEELLTDPENRVPTAYDLQLLGAVLTQMGAVLNKPME